MKTKNKIIWEPYNYGVAELTFYDVNGSLFTGEPHEFQKKHKKLRGFRNTESGMIILINGKGKVEVLLKQKSIKN
jgi:hypothetical protein